MHALGVLYPTARRTSGAEVAGDLDRSSPTDLSNAAFSVLASWSPGHAPLRRDPRSAAPPPRPPQRRGLGLISPCISPGGGRCLKLWQKALVSEPPSVVCREGQRVVHEQ